MYACMRGIEKKRNPRKPPRAAPSTNQHQMCLFQNDAISDSRVLYDDGRLLGAWIFLSDHFKVSSVHSHSILVFIRPADFFLLNVFALPCYVIFLPFPVSRPAAPQVRNFQKSLLDFGQVGRELRLGRPTCDAAGRI